MKKLTIKSVLILSIVLICILQGCSRNSESVKSDLNTLSPTKANEVKPTQPVESKKEEVIKQSNQKQIPYELVTKFVEAKGYKVSVNSFGSEWVRLPKNFNEEKNGINIGKILEERNNKSKKWGLDFSSYMGKEVAYIVCGIEKGTVFEELIAFVADGKVVGAWTFVTDGTQSANDDHSLMINNLERAE